MPDRFCNHNPFILATHHKKICAWLFLLNGVLLLNRSKHIELTMASGFSPMLSSYPVLDLTSGYQHNMMRKICILATIAI
jgi:hypothetical protein